jgi:hypothetical protein
MLELLDLCVFEDIAKFHQLIQKAREQLQVVRDQPSPNPSLDSPALLCFDNLVARRLNTFLPLRILEMRSISQTWDAIDVLLDGWSELSILSTTTNISTWAVR